MDKMIVRGGDTRLQGTVKVVGAKNDVKRIRELKRLKYI